MSKDVYNLNSMSDGELYNWLSQQQEHSEEYNAGINETMNRIAIAEETFDRKDPVHKRELIVIAVAFAVLVLIIIAIVLSF